MSRRLFVGMSIELLVFVIVVGVGSAGLLLWRGGPVLLPLAERVQQFFGRATPAPTVPPGGLEETTAKPGGYACTDGKSFTLTVRGDGTARVSGSDRSNGVILRRTQATNIWASADGLVAVREIADYTVLVENGTTTRDLCRLR